MFYLHEDDNRRILALLVRAWRMRVFKTQKECADRIGLESQTISYFENYPPPPKTKVYRGDLEKIIDSFEFSNAKIKDLALWLFEGKEFEEYDYKEARREIIDLLKEIVGVYEDLAENSLKRGKNHNQKRERRKVKILPYREDTELVGKELLDQERCDSIWIYMRQLPGFTSRCFKLNSKALPIEKDGITESDKQRVTTFLSKVDQFGARVIHEKTSIENYLRDETILDREEHIRIIIGLMKKYKNFQVRLAPQTTPFEFQINGLKHVFLRARLGSSEPQDQIPKSDNYLRYITFTSEENVLPFIIEFEQVWLGLEDDQPNNHTVIKMLEEIIKNNPNKEKEQLKFPFD